MDDSFTSGLLAVAEVEDEAVLAAEDDDDGGVSSEPERDSDLEAATMIGGVDSKADVKSPDRLRNRLIVLPTDHKRTQQDLAAERRRAILSRSSPARSIN